jgi:N-methylhydantoinase A
MIEKPRPPRLEGTGSLEAALKGKRPAIFQASGEATSTPVYDGSKLGVGVSVPGPAIIEEVTTTIVIEPGWTAALHESGSYLLTRKD